MTFKCGANDKNDTDKFIRCDNFIDGKFVPPESCSYMSVESPINGAKIGEVALSSIIDVDNAVKAAEVAFHRWSNHFTLKSRAALLLKFHSLICDHAPELAKLIVSENGKNITEALADIAKGNETVEYACSLASLVPGKQMRVSSDVYCQDRRDPVGIVGSIVPFNFPFMVPMWTVPIALVLGNCVILKPSEKVPTTMRRVAELWMTLMQGSGIPSGVFQIVNGTADTVQALIHHPSVKAITFVGSSPVAEIVATSCRQIHKRVTALGGAKNHLVALPDCDIDQTSTDIVVSYAGCAGQRCMAASVLLIIGTGTTQTKLLEAVIEKSKKIQPGTNPGCMGPVIDKRSFDKIQSYISEAETTVGADILLDGRFTWSKDQLGAEGGNWIGPTVIRHKNASDRAMKEEIFGPVLSVYYAASWEEAIQIENSSEFGNAACVYTTNGGNAEWFINRFRAAMLGVNIGIPVPREPFSFGGLSGTKSKFGDMDITGDGAVEFFTNRKKITSRWTISQELLAVTKHEGPVDQAHFSGRM